MRSISRPVVCRGCLHGDSFRRRRGSGALSLTTIEKAMARARAALHLGVATLGAMGQEVLLVNWSQTVEAQLGQMSFEVRNVFLQIMCRGRANKSDSSFPRQKGTWWIELHGRTKPNAEMSLLSGYVT